MSDNGVNAVFESFQKNLDKEQEIREVKCVHELCFYIKLFKCKFYLFKCYCLVYSDIFLGNP